MSTVYTSRPATPKAGLEPHSRPVVLSDSTVAGSDNPFMAWRIAVVIVAGIFLAYGTVFVFLTIDRQSHSVSDTLRPFVITIGPVWLVAALAGGELIAAGVRKR